jgi:site-specific DNA-methyltransferase (adenine-specific)
VEGSDAVSDIETGAGWELRLGDCIEGMRALADASVEVCITDPPYESEAHTKQRRQKGRTTRPGANQAWRAVNGKPLSFPPMTPERRRAVSLEIGRVTIERAVVFCQGEAIGDWRHDLQASGLRYRRSIPWVKPDAMPSLHGLWPGQAFESIVTADWLDDAEWEALVLASRQGARPCPLGGKAVEYRFTRARAGQPGGPGGTEAPHETTKPLALMLKLVEHFTHHGDLVLDPYAGSGTTGIACLMLGRRFLGFELDPSAFAVAARRLRGDEAKPRAEQPGLFDGLQP